MFCSDRRKRQVACNSAQQLVNILDAKSITLMRELHRRTCSCWIFSSCSVVSSATVVNMSPSSVTRDFFIVFSKNAHPSVKSKFCTVFYSHCTPCCWQRYVELELFSLFSSWNNSPNCSLVTTNVFSPFTNTRIHFVLYYGIVHHPLCFHRYSSARTATFGPIFLSRRSPFLAVTAIPRRCSVWHKNTGTHQPPADHAFFSFRRHENESDLLKTTDSDRD